MSVIIIAMKAGILATISIGLLGASVTLLVVSIQKDIAYAIQLRIVSGILALAFVYFLIETIRFGHWELHYTHDGTAIKPSPELIIAKSIRWLKDC